MGGSLGPFDRGFNLIPKYPLPAWLQILPLLSLQCSWVRFLASPFYFLPNSLPIVGKKVIYEAIFISRVLPVKTHVAH